LSGTLSKIGEMTDGGYIILLTCPGHHNQPSQKQQIYFLNSGGWKSKIKVQLGLVSDIAPIPGLKMATFSLCPHVAFSVCGKGRREREKEERIRREKEERGKERERGKECTEQALVSPLLLRVLSGLGLQPYEFI
jgi:hypothetical protein